MALHLKVVISVVLNGYLKGVIGLSRHDEISVEFAFRGSKFICGVEAMPLTIAGLVAHLISQFPTTHPQSSDPLRTDEQRRSLGIAGLMLNFLR
jgi:hypothetical protein